MLCVIIPFGGIYCVKTLKDLTLNFKNNLKASAMCESFKLVQTGVL